jgi:cell wall-associated NlpC family hydrolase
LSTRIAGRHRATARPKTPLTVLAEAVTANAGTVGRRSAVIAASSGLVVTMGLPAANAAPVTDTQTDSAPAPSAEPKAPEAAPAPEVSVPSDAPVTFAGTTLTAVTPPPPPPPPAPEPRPAQRASRDSTRVSLSTTAAPSEVGGSIVAIASRYVGVMYRYGGTTPAGFDCSGYTQYVYAQAGISIPRTSSAQAAGGRRVSAAEARPGDLVWTEGHIGIYAGGNMMYDSPRTGKAVAKREIWYTPTFIRYDG